MSYMRDSDRRTRGVGAIAATDNVSTARRMRQAQVHHATRLRDRQMSAIAQGALSGDRVPLRNEGRDSTPGPPIRIYDPPPPRLLQNPPATSLPVIIAPTIGGLIGPAKVPPTIAPVIAPTIGGLIGPAKVPPTIAPPASSGGGGGGGAGYKGGGGSGTAPPAPIAVFAPPDLPDVAPAVDNTARNLVIAGGAAIAAYLLFFRRGGDA